MICRQWVFPSPLRTIIPTVSASGKFLHDDYFHVLARLGTAMRADVLERLAGRERERRHRVRDHIVLPRNILYQQVELGQHLVPAGPPPRWPRRCVHRLVNPVI
jgi:hypothetical protein